MRLVVVLVAACGQAARTPPPRVVPPPAAPEPPPPKNANWYCFTSDPFNAECARDQVTCAADALDMKEHARSVTPCRGVENVFCHQYADDPNAAPLCYPTAEYCENGRKIMEDSGLQSECVVTVGGLVPAMKAPPGPKWWCFTSDDPYNAECVHEQPHCQRDAADFRSDTVSPCFAVAIVYCHHFIGSDDPDPLCYPSREYCENGRRLMGEDSQTACVQKGR